MLWLCLLVSRMDVSKLNINHNHSNLNSYHIIVQYIFASLTFCCMLFFLFQVSNMNSDEGWLRVVFVFVSKWVLIN